MNNKIAVIGIGRLGLCFALNLERSGFEVFGFDVNEAYLTEIRNKTLKSVEPDLETYLQQADLLHVSSDLSIISTENIETIFILVPTPSLPDGSFSHHYLDEVAQRLKKIRKSDTVRHLIIGCTTMPGYCDDLASDLEGYGFTVSYNPEFIAQGSIIHDQQNPDQILIGEGDPEATGKLKQVYSKMCTSQPIVHVMNRKSAEICKLATNCFLTMKISFANAIGDLASGAGAEPDKILAAIGADSRIGEKYLRYGFGFGGPCFPRDNQALIAFANEAGHNLHLSKSTIQVNQEHLDFQFNQLISSDRTVYEFDSVFYKNGTDILEESQQLKLALKLAEAGKRVSIKNTLGIQERLNAMYPGLFEFYE